MFKSSWYYLMPWHNITSCKESTALATLILSYKNYDQIICSHVFFYPENTNTISYHLFYHYIEVKKNTIDYYDFEYGKCSISSIFALLEMRIEFFWHGWRTMNSVSRENTFYSTCTCFNIFYLIENLWIIEQG
jgi:hypothetical protein